MQATQNFTPHALNGQQSPEFLFFKKELITEWAKTINMLVEALNSDSPIPPLTFVEVWHEARAAAENIAGRMRRADIEQLVCSTLTGFDLAAADAAWFILDSGLTTVGAEIKKLTPEARRQLASIIAEGVNDDR